MRTCLQACVSLMSGLSKSLSLPPQKNCLSFGYFVPRLYLSKACNPDWHTLAKVFTDFPHCIHSLRRIRICSCRIIKASVHPSEAGDKNTTWFIQTVSYRKPRCWPCIERTWAAPSHAHTQNQAWKCESEVCNCSNLPTNKLEDYIYLPHLSLLSIVPEENVQTSKIKNAKHSYADYLKQFKSPLQSISQAWRLQESKSISWPYIPLPANENNLNGILPRRSKWHLKQCWLEDTLIQWIIVFQSWEVCFIFSLQ